MNRLLMTIVFLAVLFCFVVGCTSAPDSVQPKSMRQFPLPCHTIHESTWSMYIFDDRSFVKVSAGGVMVTGPVLESGNWQALDALDDPDFERLIRNECETLSKR